MKWSQGVAVTTWVFVLTAISPCQQAPQRPQPVTKTFSVNGRPVQTSLVQIDNRLYIALEDIASSLDGSLTTKATTIDLTFPISNCDQNASSSYAANAAGTVKGTLTYYFNANYGSRPDVGAKVWIIKGGSISIPETDNVLNTRSELVLVDESKQQTKLPFVARAVADGSGSVTLANIPVGVYTVVMQSSHAIGGVGKEKVNSRDIMGRFIFLTIEISAGQVVDISTDFGVSAF